MDWAEIARALMLVVLGAAMQSAWTAWQIRRSEQHIDSADTETARREQTHALFQRTSSSDNCAIETTSPPSNLVRLRHKPVNLWHQDVTPTNDDGVGSAGLQRSRSSISLNSNSTLSSHLLDRERASSKPKRKDFKTAGKSSGILIRESCCTCECVRSSDTQC